MLADCYNLEKIDVSYFETEKVQNMSGFGIAIK